MFHDERPHAAANVAAKVCINCPTWKNKPLLSNKTVNMLFAADFCVVVQTCQSPEMFGNFSNESSAHDGIAINVPRRFKCVRDRLPNLIQKFLLL